jgi:hypothetical protein
MNEKADLDCSVFQIGRSSASPRNGAGEDGPSLPPMRVPPNTTLPKLQPTKNKKARTSFSFPPAHTNSWSDTSLRSAFLLSPRIRLRPRVICRRASMWRGGESFGIRATWITSSLRFLATHSLLVLPLHPKMRPSAKARAWMEQQERARAIRRKGKGRDRLHPPLRRPAGVYAALGMG